MGEHDLTLPEARPCAQLFCLVTEAMTAKLPLRPEGGDPAGGEKAGHFDPWTVEIDGNERLTAI
jgi:hypothetical protein